MSRDCLGFPELALQLAGEMTGVRLSRSTDGPRECCPFGYGRINYLLEILVKRPKKVVGDAVRGLYPERCQSPLVYELLATLPRAAVKRGKRWANVEVMYVH
jgi:hypothetical protein